MSGTNQDLLSAAQALVGATNGAPLATTGEVTDQYYAQNLAFTTSTVGGVTQYNVTGLTQVSATIAKNPPALQFSNARDGVNGTTGQFATLIDVQKYSKQGTLLSVVTYDVVAADAHHILLFADIDPTGTNGTGILLANDNSLFNSSSSYLLAGGQSYTIADTTANGVPNPFGVCFAAGTMVRTALGARAVETLVAGDLVETVDGAIKPVIWVGARTVDLASADAARVQPVRIKADAFAPGLPERDLVLSPDHALFIDGVFVQAKLLVNGGSVVVDPAQGAITYVHVELDRHDVLIAEGVAAETFLDCGNRGQFEAGVGPVDFGTTPSFYDERGYAPLALDADVVFPIWSRVAERAASMGLPVAIPAITHEPDLRVVAGGHEIRAARVDGGRHVFTLPAGVDAIRIVSRAAAPSETQPWLVDRRRLGVAVSRVAVAGIELPLDTAGEGFWANESGFRWTNGDAVIALAPAGTDRLVELDVSGTVAYPQHAAA